MRIDFGSYYMWQLVSQQVARTEKVQNCLNPKFAKKFVIDYYFEMVQKLIFGIYDIDNKTVDLSDDDFLGQLEVTLGQVGRTWPDVVSNLCSEALKSPSFLDFLLLTLEQNNILCP